MCVYLIAMYMYCDTALCCICACVAAHCIVRESAAHRRERRVVHEIGEVLVGGPDGALDVIVQAGRDARDRPDVRVRHLRDREGVSGRSIVKCNT